MSVCFFGFRTSRSKLLLKTTRCYATLPPEDNWEIANNISHFLQYMDRGKERQFAELFTENGICEVTKFNRVYQGYLVVCYLCSWLIICDGRA